MRAMAKNTAGNHITPCYILNGANLLGEKPPFRHSPLAGPVERELRRTVGVGSHCVPRKPQPPGPMCFHAPWRRASILRVR